MPLKSYRPVLCCCAPSVARHSSYLHRLIWHEEHMLWHQLLQHSLWDHLVQLNWLYTLIKHSHTVTYRVKKKMQTNF